MAEAERYSEETARTWAEVDLGRIGRNAERAQAFAGDGAFLMAVVKADAYGHGAARVARECARAGVGHFGVATVAEGRELREDAGIRDADVCVFTPFLPAEAEAIVRADLIPFVSSREHLDALLAVAHRAERPVRCFLKVDTGMGRGGALPGEARELWETVAGGPDRNLRITGISTHLSSADEPTGDGDRATRAQFEAFERFVAEAGDLAAAGSRGNGDGGGVWLSVTNSPGTLRFLGAARQALPRRGVRGLLVRCGLLLYGIEPCRDAFAEAGLDLEPALAWKARVTLVKDLPAGATVGYSRTHTLARPSRVATVAAGYADGLPRRLSDTGHVLLHGRRCPILGRISMDQCQIDVTDVPEPVRLGDVVTILGSDGPVHQTALELAEAADTTPHEPTCALSRRVPRLYVRRGGAAGGGE